MRLNCYVGYNVVVVKNGRRICGSGAALANAPLAQNKAYFEAKLQSSGQRYRLCLQNYASLALFCVIIISMKLSVCSICSSDRSVIA